MSRPEVSIMTEVPDIDKLELSSKILSPTIKMLGGLLGEVIIEQEHPQELDLIENLRLMAKRFREDGEIEALDDLHTSVSRLDPDQRAIVIKAFSIFFQLANLAEEDYRIRLNRMYQTRESRDDTLAATIRSAKDTGYSLNRLLDLLAAIQFKFVWTAHPTEARRMTSMMKLREIYLLLEKIQGLDEGSLDYTKIRDTIKRHITLFWQSDDLREEKIHILDEVRANLFYFDHTVFETLPEILEDLRLTIKDVYEAGRDADIRIPDFIHFGSWVGGDRDGHPGVTSAVTIQTLLLHKRLCLRKYLEAVRDLIRDLSSSLNQVPISEDLKRSLEEDSRALSDFAGQTDQLNRYEPYRRKLDFMRVKLENSLEEVEKTAVEFGLGQTLINFKKMIPPESVAKPPLYARSREFLSDLELIDRSLRDNRGRQIAEGALGKLITQVEIFGFHLAPLDLRQHSKEHWNALDDIFLRVGLPKPSGLEFEERKKRLKSEICSLRPLGVGSYLEELDAATRELLSTLEVARNSIEVISPRSIDAYIISMTRDESDIYALMLLLIEKGLIKIEDGRVCRADLDLVPLFETKADLANAPEVMDRLFDDPLYRSLLECRGHVQEIMIGYSDSTKDVGYLQSNYGLLTAQLELLKVAESHRINLKIFHGRGGSISRGGGPTNRAILSQPPGAVSRMKITEQGEVIGSNYSNPKIAYRHLEQIISAVLKRSIEDIDLPPEENPANPSQEFLFYFGAMAGKACRVYEDMVKEDPGFIPFYLEYTPLDLIERATIGSRPSRRAGRDTRDITTLRAIPWIFSWMQTRLIFPAYYGVGSALEAFGKDESIEVVKRMYREWPYFASLIDNLQMVFLKADLDIASKYLDLVETSPDKAGRIFARIKSEYETTRRMILEITEAGDVFEFFPDVRNSILRRNPYIDPLSLIQVELLKKWRAEGRPDDLGTRGILRALLQTVNGIAAGLRNTG